MWKLAVAFEKASVCDCLRNVLESTGEFICLICRNAAQVKRIAGRTRLDLVVCGFKLDGESCETLHLALPQQCGMLMVAPQAQLDLCAAAGVFKLPVPVRRSELLVLVRQMVQRPRTSGNPVRRTKEEQSLIEQAKETLMARCGMTEEQAHRFLQKQSMCHGVRMPDAARRVLEGVTQGMGG